MNASVLGVGIVLFIVGVGLGVSTPLLVACPPGQNCNNKVGNLVGTVTNVTSGSGIQGATVQLLQNGAVKDSSVTVSTGYFAFLAAAAGGYTISVSAKGYVGFQGSTSIAPGTTGSYNVKLVNVQASTGGSSSGTGCTPTPSGSCPIPPAPTSFVGSFQGAVYDAGTLIPINGSSVQLFGRVNASATTGATGLFGFTVPAPVNYSVNVIAQGYKTFIGYANLPANTTTVINYFLSPMNSTSSSKQTLSNLPATFGPVSILLSGAGILMAVVGIVLPRRH